MKDRAILFQKQSDAFKDEFISTWKKAIESWGFKTYEIIKDKTDLINTCVYELLKHIATNEVSTNQQNILLGPINYETAAFDFIEISSYEINYCINALKKDARNFIIALNRYSLLSSINKNKAIELLSGIRNDTLLSNKQLILGNIAVSSLLSSAVFMLGCLTYGLIQEDDWYLKMFAKMILPMFLLACVNAGVLIYLEDGPCSPKKQLEKFKREVIRAPILIQYSQQPRAISVYDDKFTVTDSKLRKRNNI